MPGVNSQWHGDHIKQFKHSDVAVAVSTKTGLLTPIVFKAEQLGLSQIAAKTKEVAEKARNGHLLPAEYQVQTNSYTYFFFLYFYFKSHLRFCKLLGRYLHYFQLGYVRCEQLLCYH